MDVTVVAELKALQRQLADAEIRTLNREATLSEHLQVRLEVVSLERDAALRDGEEHRLLLNAAVTGAAALTEEVATLKRQLTDSEQKRESLQRTSATILSDAQENERCLTATIRQLQDDLKQRDAQISQLVLHRAQRSDVATSTHNTSCPAADREFMVNDDGGDTILSNESTDDGDDDEDVIGTAGLSHVPPRAVSVTAKRAMDALWDTIAELEGTGRIRNSARTSVARTNDSSSDVCLEAPFRSGSAGASTSRSVGSLRVLADRSNRFSTLAEKKKLRSGTATSSLDGAQRPTGSRAGMRTWNSTMAASLR